MTRASLFAGLLAAAEATFRIPDEMAYNQVLFAGTHNSAINLGKHTVGRARKAVGGEYPSEASNAYQYPVMDQRLSVRDQLEQGIRVIDLEIAAISGDWECKTPPPEGCGNGRCVSSRTGILGKCFSCCPFIVSHGNLDQSVKYRLGYTHPENIFEPMAEWLAQNPEEIVTLFLINTHGNAAPPHGSIIDRLNTSGVLPYVWNADPGSSFTSFPTLGEMRSSGRTVLITGQWGPGTTGSHVDASDYKSAEGTCADSTPCLEGWDSVTFEQLAPERAVLTPSGVPAANALFHVDNLSSRRGRGDKTYAMDLPLPNLLTDEPYVAGGNPAQGALAADYDHVRAVEKRWSELLAPRGMGPNWILVDFFNTTTPHGRPSRTLLPNPSEGLIRAVADINQERAAAWRASTAASIV